MSRNLFTKNFFSVGLVATKNRWKTESEDRDRGFFFFFFFWGGGGGGVFHYRVCNENFVIVKSKVKRRTVRESFD